MSAALDVVTIGRSSVDLYGQQIGGRLEDMASFAKSVGGSPTNTAIGGVAARPQGRARHRASATSISGASSASSSRREGVDTRGVKTDPERLTALVDPRRAGRQALPADLLSRQLRRHGARRGRHRRGLHRVGQSRVPLGHALLDRHHRRHEPQGDPRRESRRAARRLRRRLPPEPLGARRPRRRRGALHPLRHGHGAPADHRAGLRPHRRHRGGAAHPRRRAGHARSAAPHPRAHAGDARVQARPDGLRGLPRRHPGSLEDGIKGRASRSRSTTCSAPATPSWAASCAAGFGTSRWRQACAYANACGAFAVSRLLCSPEYPTWEELQHFLRHGAATPRLRLDPALGHIHWATTRRPAPATLKALAIDHRWQLEAMADRLGAPRERISGFKRLAVRAVAQVARARPPVRASRLGLPASHLSMRRVRR